MQAVPFTLADALDEPTCESGVAMFGGAALTLEFAAAGATRRVVIGVEDFAACKFRRGLFGARLHLHAAGPGALGSVPGAAGDVVALQFAREWREQAADLADRLSVAIAEERK
jgi:hypothetical protein